MAELLLSGLTRRFGDTIALDQVSLEIADGALVTLLGPSGCGKTTTLRLIAGFIDPDAGSIHLHGRLISEPGRSLPPEDRNMAMIFQSYALWPHMTVAENIGYGLRLRRLGRAEVEGRVRRMLDVVRLDGIADRYPAELSGGQQQRVALARAMVVEPQTLLLDEPLSNLDAGLREEMRFEIRRLHDAFRTTSVYVTHDQIEAMTTADQIVVMNHGRIEQAGPPEEVFARPDSAFVAQFLGGTNLLRGRHQGGGLVRFDGFTLRSGSGRLGQGETALSIRPHEIRLVGTARQGEQNVLPARVLRTTFLGATRDVWAEVELGGGACEAPAPVFRVSLPAGVPVATGEHIDLFLPPEHCRALAR
ncbi:MAG: ABC transporter ATP-binding protein [Acetobacteraceae bacterium]|nr:ABC transporter ATP-binding protein [Acetobacteraceae bacterium]